MTSVFSSILNWFSLFSQYNILYIMATIIPQRLKPNIISHLLNISLIISCLATLLIAISGDNPQYIHYNDNNNSNQTNTMIAVENSIAENYTTLRVFHAILVLTADITLLVGVIIGHKHRTGSGHTIALIVLFVVMVFLLCRPSMFSSIIHQIIFILIYMFCLMIKSETLIIDIKK
ncbi:uncharacterized protein LOC128964331 [Oppia nitens]|uniref:uncharacterized protein LOC128964331 n=1 Tax=Oppia nitens TaxID=1686743 RepID=UPI0023DB1B83|nr:uncharacterized protein LOC128964331 [Oppia nitens]